MLCLFFVDTEKFYTEVQEKILARYNKTFDWSLKAKMMGRKAIEAATLFVEECGISDSLSPEAFIVERESMLQDLFPTSDLMPGYNTMRLLTQRQIFLRLCSLVEHNRRYIYITFGDMISFSDIGASRLLRHLHGKGIPICVATGYLFLHHHHNTTTFRLQMAFSVSFFIFLPYLICLVSLMICSTHTRHFDLKTQRHRELFSLMHHIVRGDDPEVKQGKPAPDGFLAAARRFEVIHTIHDCSS